jgi:hypothetical protein
VVLALEVWSSRPDWCGRLGHLQRAVLFG